MSLSIGLRLNIKVQLSIVKRAKYKLLVAIAKTFP
jgi:hypothetical protein